jgi:tetratricopeptide (TPR) repeat protein/transcriptional regulator with XRE-family HTH domain
VSDESADGSRSAPTPAQQFGSYIRKLREQQGLTLRKLGTLVHYSASRLSRLEAGKLPPTEELAEALDKLLDQGNGRLLILAQGAKAEPFADLPPAPPNFVGREQTLRRLDTLLLDRAAQERQHVVCLHGPPGVGKTDLAREWANRHQRAFWPVLYADLRGFDPRQAASISEVLDKLLRSLGVQAGKIPAGNDERRALLRRHLEERRHPDRRVLIVYDNARDSRQVADLLPGIAGTSVLVTSRARLSGLVISAGAESLAVTPMSDQDATSLVCAFVGADRATAEPDAVAKIVRLCGSLPLALAIAAERVAGSDVVSIDEHADRLENQALELQVENDESSGVRPAFFTSYNQLNPAQQEMFRLCGLHPGAEFSAASAAALADVSDHEALRLLEQLAQLSLVQQLPARMFRLHDLLRDYAAEEACRPSLAGERDAAVDRLVQWYLHSVNAMSWAITPERPGHHVRLDPPPAGVTPAHFTAFDNAYRWAVCELTTITSVAEMALQEDMLFEAWRIGSDAFDFFIHRRPITTWIDTLTIAMDAAERSGDHLRIAQSAEELGEGLLRRGRPEDLDRARALNQRAIEVCAGDMPNRYLAFAHIELGDVEAKRGNHASSAQYYEQALGIAQAAHARVGQTLAHTKLGIAYRELGQIDRAIEHGLTSFTMLQEDDDPHGMGFAAVPLARSYRVAARLEEALHFCDQADKAYRRRNDPQGAAEALGERALILRLLGEPAAAASAFRRALDRLAETDIATAADLERQWQSLEAP